MAYIVQQGNTPFWLAMWTGENGKKRKRSTRVRVVPNARLDGFIETKAQAKSRAQMIADKFEQAERGKATAAKLRETINELVPQTMALPSIKEQLEKHLSLPMAAQTRRNHENAVRQFLAWLGADAARKIDELKTDTIQAWVNHRIGQVARSTASAQLCIIKAAFNAAIRQRIIPYSPFDGVELPKAVDRSKVNKIPFTVDDLQFLIAHLPDEWRSMVLCSLLLGGLRISDAALLRWDAFDLMDENTATYSLYTKKNASEVVLPVIAPLYSHLMNRRRRSVYVHPNMAARYLKSKSRLSENFTSFVLAYGLSESVLPVAGRKNSASRKTFHSIRYAVATLLAAAGVDSLIVMRIQTHKASNVHFGYVLPNAEQMRPALEKLAQIVGVEV